MSLESHQLKFILEGAIMASAEPIDIAGLERLFVEELEPPTADTIKMALAELALEYAERGIELKEVANGYRFQAKTELAPWISKLWEERPARYSRAVLETLAIIAYRQPITRAEIEDVRGVVVSSHIIKTLIERNWIREVGIKEVPGRPTLLATTKDFLDYFNLKKLDELPSLADLQDLEEIEKQVEAKLVQGKLALDVPADEILLEEATSDSPDIQEESPSEESTQEISMEEQVAEEIVDEDMANEEPLNEEILSEEIVDEEEQTEAPLTEEEMHEQTH